MLFYCYKHSAQSLIRKKNFFRHENELKMKTMCRLQIELQKLL